MQSLWICSDGFIKVYQMEAKYRANGCFLFGCISKLTKLPTQKQKLHYTVHSSTELTNHTL